MPYMEVDMLEVVCAGPTIHVKHSTYNTSFIYIYIYICVCVYICIYVYVELFTCMFALHISPLGSRPPHMV